MVRFRSIALPGDGEMRELRSTPGFHGHFPSGGSPMVRKRAEAGTHPPAPSLWEGSGHTIMGAYMQLICMYAEGGRVTCAGE